MFPIHVPPTPFLGDVVCPLPLPPAPQSPEVLIEWDLTASMVDAYGTSMQIKNYGGEARSGWSAARGWTEWVLEPWPDVIQTSAR
eukprot:4627172-Prymnesium_polylepis.1